MSFCKQEETSFSDEIIKKGFFHAITKAVDKLGATTPNPAVGCCLVDKNGDIIISVAHNAAGENHAEAEAFKKAKEKQSLEKIYAAFVTLEPCNHFGRTPPCSHLFVKYPIKELWIGCRDITPHAQGGLDHIKKETNCKIFLLENFKNFSSLFHDCCALNAPFFSRILKKRPWITVKQALNIQKTMIPPRGKKTFTSQSSLIYAHQIRRACDAIITGIGTVLADNPSFTVRHILNHKIKRKKLLIVLDQHNRTPKDWIKERETDNFKVISCKNENELLIYLKKEEINWALVEAGPITLKNFKEKNLWDDWLLIEQQKDDDKLTINLNVSHNITDSPLFLLKKYSKKDC